jgi:hypothetical protein
MYLLRKSRCPEEQKSHRQSRQQTAARQNVFLFSASEPEKRPCFRGYRSAKTKFELYQEQAAVREFARRMIFGHVV